MLPTRPQHNTNIPKMDLLPHFLATLALVVVPIFLFYTLKNTEPKRSPKHTKTTQPPEPAGALPFIGHLHLLRGALPLARTLGSMADEAGPVYSLRLAHRRRAVVVTTWEATKDCFTTNDRALATRPKTAFGRLIGYGYASFAIAPYGPYWRDIRKMVTHELFTAHQIPKLNSVLFIELNHFIKDLFSISVKNCGSDPVKLLGLDGWIEDLTFNTTTRLVVGKPCSGGRGGAEGRRLKEAVKRALYLSGVFVVSDMVPWVEWFDFGGYAREMKETAEVIDGVLREWLEEHKQERNGDGGEDKDFMDVMLSSVAEGTTMSGYNRDTVIKATILILIATGTESTSETLIWAISLLVNNHQVLERAHNEIDMKVGKDKWVEESDIKNLTYLQAIVKETLRLYPPGPLAGPHEATEDCQISGYHVSKGTRLIINLWKLHRDPRVWSNPDDFEPERFLKAHANVDYRDQHYEYIPFSSGRRMCPGMTYGLQVVHLTLARLLQGFNLATLMDAPVDMTEGIGIALPKLKPLEVVLKPRLSQELYESL